MLLATSGQFAPSLQSRLERLARVMPFHEAEAAGLTGQIEVLVTRGKLVVDEAQMKQMASLRLIVKAGSGLDTIDVETARRRNIRVERTGGSEGSVAELGIGLLFACLRRIPVLDAATRENDFGAKDANTGSELRGRRIGVVGYGAIGQRFAAIASALGMTVGIFDRSARMAEKRAQMDGVGARSFDTLDEIFAWSDVLSLHLPLVAETKGMINADLLDKARPGFVLINTARAELVDQAALLAGLESGRVAAAGLDVHYADGNAPIFARRNVVVTPHIGAQTHEAKAVIADRILEVLSTCLAPER